MTEYSNIHNKLLNHFMEKYEKDKGKSFNLDYMKPIQYTHIVIEAYSTDGEVFTAFYRSNETVDDVVYEKGNDWYPNSTGYKK